jgi:CubicO group peptidase (beta-lactamase class C family)
MAPCWLVKKVKVIYSKGFGMANAEKDLPNKSSTKFRIGSVTKQFTAMLIVQLAADKKLDLHAPISKYLPAYPKKNGDLITIHHLLTHTSGIPNFTDFPGFQEAQGKSYQPEELVRLFSDSALEFKPGSTFSYSNSGYILLGYLIEKITGKPYEQVLQENILTPLKMYNTGYDHNKELKDMAVGYDSRSGFQKARYVDMSVPFSAGALYSTLKIFIPGTRHSIQKNFFPKNTWTCCLTAT